MTTGNLLDNLKLPPHDYRAVNKRDRRQSRVGQRDSAKNCKVKLRGGLLLGELTFRALWGSNRCGGDMLFRVNLRWSGSSAPEQERIDQLAEQRG